MVEEHVEEIEKVKRAIESNHGNLGNLDEISKVFYLAIKIDEKLNPIQAGSSGHRVSPNDLFMGFAILNYVSNSSNTIINHYLGDFDPFVNIEFDELSSFQKHEKDIKYYQSYVGGRVCGDIARDAYSIHKRMTNNVGHLALLASIVKHANPPLKSKLNKAFLEGYDYYLLALIHRYHPGQLSLFRDYLLGSDGPYKELPIVNHYFTQDLRRVIHDEWSVSLDVTATAALYYNYKYVSGVGNSSAKKFHNHYLLYSILAGTCTDCGKTPLVEALIQKYGIDLVRGLIEPLDDLVTGILLNLDIITLMSCEQSFVGPDKMLFESVLEMMILSPDGYREVTADDLLLALLWRIPFSDTESDPLYEVSLKFGDFQSLIRGLLSLESLDQDLRKRINRYTSEFKNDRRKEVESDNVPITIESKIPVSIGRLFTTERDSRDLGGSLVDYSTAITEIFNNAVRSQKRPTLNKNEKSEDFCFALFGPWGQGKSTLIGHVEEQLKDTGFATVKFNAWKYPRRPEVWVYLYETIKKAAQGENWLTRLAFGLRFNLSKDFGWKLFVPAFSILVISGLSHLLKLSLKLPEIKAVQDDTINLMLYVPVLSFIVLAAFPIYGLIKYFKSVNEKFLPKLTECFSVPDHIEHLGLQATIGEDLKRTLKTWTTDTSKGHWILYFVSILCVVLAFLLQLYKACDYLACGVILLILILVTLFLVFTISVAITKPDSPDKIHLVVDDLDRCEHAEMLAVIESLRVCLDDPEISRMLFVSMLIDREILSHAICEKYESLLKSSKSGNFGYCSRFCNESLIHEQIDKYFLVSFEIPPLSKSELASISKSILGDPPKIELKTAKEPSVTKANVTEQSNVKSDSNDNEEIHNADINRLKNSYVEVAEPDLRPKRKTKSNKIDLVESSEDDAEKELEDYEILELTKLVNLIQDRAIEMGKGSVTPRAIRQLKMRYFLLRVLVKNLGKKDSVSDLIQGLKEYYLGRDVKSPRVRELIHMVAGFPQYGSGQRVRKDTENVSN